MPILKDILDSVVSDFHQARIAADIRSVEMMEEYAKHPYLKEFNVPTFGFEKVEMEIPVFLSESTKTSSSENSGLSALAVNELSARFLISQVEKVRGKKVLKKDQERLHASLKKLSNQSSELREDSKAFADYVKASTKSAEVLFPANTKMPQGFAAKTSRGLKEHLLQHAAEAEKEKETSATEIVASFSKDAANMASDPTVIKLELRETSLRWELIPTEEEGKFKKVLIQE